MNESQEAKFYRKHNVPHDLRTPATRRFLVAAECEHAIARSQALIRQEIALIRGEYVEPIVTQEDK